MNGQNARPPSINPCSTIGPRQSAGKNVRAATMMITPVSVRPKVQPCVGNVPAEQVFCFATGNTARIRALTCGIIEPGRAADFVLMDRAQHSAGRDLLDSVRKGDLPGIGMVIIDGLVRIGRSRNTPPATIVPDVVKS